MNKRHRSERLVAVVVTHNRLSHISKTIEKLLESSPEELDAIVVVDNASVDGTAAWLASLEEPRINIVTSDTNTGGAGGFEAGMRFACETLDPDWLILMDDDGRPESGALTEFRNGEWSSFDAVAAAVYTPRGEICDINRPSLNPFWRAGAFVKTLFGGGREGFHLGENEYSSSEILEIDGASFVGLFLARKAIDKVGYPQGDLFIYGDDALYTLKLTKSGGRVAFAPNIRFEHDFLSMREGEKRFRPLWKTYYHHRNLLLVYRLAAGPWFWLALFLILPKWALKVRHHKGERRAFLSLQRRAIMDGLTQRTNRDHDEIVAMSKRP